GAAEDAAMKFHWRRTSLAGRLALYAALHGALAAAVATVVAVVTRQPAIALAAAVAASVLAAALTSGRALSAAQRTMGALADGIRSFRDGEFSIRVANAREDE